MSDELPTTLEELVAPLPTPPARYLMAVEDKLIPFQGYGPVPPDRPRFPVWRYREAAQTARAQELGISVSDLAVQAIAVEYLGGDTIGWSNLADWNGSEEATAANDFTVALDWFTTQHESGAMTWDVERNLHVLHRIDGVEPS